jgi:hypothetical protein
MPGYHQLDAGMRHPAPVAQIMAGFPFTFVVSGVLFGRSLPGGHPRGRQVPLPPLRLPSRRTAGNDFPARNHVGSPGRPYGAADVATWTKLGDPIQTLPVLPRRVAAGLQVVSEGG